MGIGNSLDTPLGRILVIGQRDPDQAVWTIQARAGRVPQREGGNDGQTPGVHGLRTLWMRSVARTIDTDDDAVPFLDPTLLDAFVPKGDSDGKFRLTIMGSDADVTLGHEQRIVLEPLREQPRNNRQREHPVLEVSPLVLAAGTLSVSDPTPLTGILPGEVVTTERVDLDRSGVVYTARAETPKTHKKIATRVRLTFRDQQLALELLPEKLSSAAAAEWLEEWRAIASMAGDTRVTAWARLNVYVGDRAPALSWPVTVDGKGKLSVDWSKVRLPARMVTVTLADQPIESQLLGPEQVMTLVPGEVEIGSTGTRFSVYAGTVAAPDLLYQYRATQRSENLSFPGGLPMVYAPAQVRASLRLAYAGFDFPEKATLTGFLQESDGWVELPFAQEQQLPDKLLTPADPKLDAVQAHGSMLVGLRRPELHEPGAVASQVPWSMRIDIPRAYEVKFEFESGKLAGIDLKMQGCAAQARGMVWLANRGPDGHDALPLVDDDPSAFFDVVLDRAVAGQLPAPFTLYGVTMSAPVRDGSGWDDAGLARWERAPKLGQQFGFSARLDVLAGPPQQGQTAAAARAWLRHPTLPVIQSMPETRSDSSSPRPHASRSLTLFEQENVAELRFDGAAGMAPAIAAARRNLFKAVANRNGEASTLAALTLPGIELRAQTPAAYLAAGAYGLPMLVEEYARAALPLPPGAELPPPPPVVTALQKEALSAMRAELARKRTNAAAQSDTMFPFGPIGDAIKFEALTLAEPRKVEASARVSAAVSVVGTTVQMGLVTFSQANPPWDWAASGDALLAGPGAAIGFGTPGKVTIGAGTDGMGGWTFADRQAGAFTFDGRGVGWSAAGAAVGELSLREIDIETATGDTRRTLASSVDALVIGGTGGPSWRLAFTDLALPATEAATWTPPANTDGRLAGIEQGWTWSLYETEQWQVAPLAFYGIFQFAPAKLSSVSVTALGFVSGTVVEGTLTLFDNNVNHAHNSRCQVALSFVRNAQGMGLVLAGIDPLDDPVGKRIYWDLDAERDASQVTSGVAQFSAVPKLHNGQLLLGAPVLDTTLFGSRTRIALPDVMTGEKDVPFPFDAPGDPLVLGLTRLNLDLANARIGALEFTAKLREGVVVKVTETLHAGNTDNVITASVIWFGNEIACQADIDDLRRTVRLFGPDRVKVEFFPGVNDAFIDDGVLCMTLALPKGNAQFAVLTHFCEMMFRAGESLYVSHLMHSTGKPASQDVLRFDGVLLRESLVTWPALAIGDIGAANSIDVQFDTAEQVTHSATFLLADHRLPGSAVSGRAKGAGLALRKPAAGSAPVVWLAEATHTLSWWTGTGRTKAAALPTRKVQCLHTLQLWGASDLAASLDERGGQFGFTPSYVGPNGASGFPNQGVRKVSLAFTGLFEPGMSKAIGALGDGWVILGNMNALCQDKKEGDLFLPLHLPFIGTGAVAESDALKILREKLAVPAAPANRVLRMSRHDVLGLPLRIDVAGATPVGRLASLPPPMTIPFARAALPSDAVSGAALEAGWFMTDGKVSESGLQVEQIQFPGRSSQRPLMPHPFPRAAVMLGYFRGWTVAEDLPALNVLVQFTGSGGKFAVKVSTVEIQPAAPTQSAVPIKAMAELIIGSTRGLARQWIDASAAGADNARQLLAIGTALTGEPTFLVVRQPHVGDTNAERSFSDIRLPPRMPDQLAFAARPLRSAKTFITDGRLTWPETKAEGAGAKRQLDSASAGRTPFQHMALGVSGLSGRIMPARVGGNLFLLDAAQVAQPGGAAAPSTVWLQEWERVAFAVRPGDRGEAMPRAFDNPVTVRPFAPSADAVAASIGRLNPALLKRKSVLMQTYLPPVIDDIDLPTRTGTMTETGMRTLRTWDDAAGRAAVQALAGAAQTRSMRTPRPVPIPANLGGSQLWRRTLGWYGDAATSCLALMGRWDMLAAEPGENGVPAWCILLGKPTRTRLEPIVQGQEQIWRGALQLACEVFHFNGADKPERHPDPAHFILDVLRKVEKLHFGLRVGADWTDYYGAAAVDRHTVEFVMQPRGVRITGSMTCSVEMGWLVKDGDIPSSAGEPDWCFVRLPPPPVTLLAGTPKPASKLNPVAFRKLVLPVFQPKPGQYPLPLVQSSVFFSDPAFDRNLSRVNALSASVPVKENVPATLWLDRPSATPGETVVLRGLCQEASARLTLSAKLKRKGGGDDGIVDLVFVFELEYARTPAPSIDVDSGEYLALPLSMLSDANGARLVPGDTVRLELTTSINAEKPVILFLPIRTGSALPAPEALYSLIGIDTVQLRGWCAQHSSVPQPEGLATHVKPQGSGIIRRALFKWLVTENANTGKLAYSICKTDLATESTHIPETLEEEF